MMLVVVQAQSHKKTSALKNTEEHGTKSGGTHQQFFSLDVAAQNLNTPS